jgi:tRNA-specific 2-thiouridylase
LEWDGTRAVVRPDAPAIAAPGQAAVFYDGERVLGGGFIRAERHAAVDFGGASA